MINLLKRKSILKMSSLEISLRDSSTKSRNQMLLLSISPKITHRKMLLKKPQLRKIQEEVAMGLLEEVTAIIMTATLDIQLRMNKTREDNSSPDKNATLDKKTVIQHMVKLTLKRIRVLQLRMYLTKMKFIIRVQQVALLVHMIEEQ